VNAHPRCPYCLDDLRPDQASVRCRECRTPHHATCFRENGGCVSYGCQGEEPSAAGLSIFARSQIRIRHPTGSAIEVGPFRIGFRELPPVPEQRPDWRCPNRYARLSLETREVREGGLVRGRAVVYVPTPISYRRVELQLFRGIAKPTYVGRVVLGAAGGLLGRSKQLLPGSHPWYLELAAPSTTPPVDPFLLEVVLVRGVIREVRSSPLHLYLLQERDDVQDRAELPDRAAFPIRIEPRPSSDDGRVPAELLEARFDHRPPRGQPGAHAGAPREAFDPGRPILPRVRAPDPFR